MADPKYIDLNADLGESPDADGLQQEIRILDYVSSANIACGGHAGTRESMILMVGEAKRRGVNIGAHPSFPDRKNFGRTPMHMDANDLSDTLTAQITDLQSITTAQGAKLSHIKPHGALYNMAADDAVLASIICTVVAQTGSNLAVVGLAGSAMEDRAKAKNIPFLAEGFADRAYTSSGRLVPRSQTGAVITDHDAQCRHALNLVRGEAKAINGSRLQTRVQTLCLHGDTDGALEAARIIRERLIGAGYKIGYPAHG